MFGGEFRNPILELERVKENTVFIKAPLLVLAVTSLGWAFSSNPLSIDSVWFFNLIPSTWTTNHWIPLITLALVAGGIYLGYKQFAQNPFLHLNLAPNANVWYEYTPRFVKTIADMSHQFDQRVIDTLVNALAKTQLTTAALMAWFDNYLIDGTVHLLIKLANYTGRLTRAIQTGQAQLYIVAAMLGLMTLLIFSVAFA